jgi:citrate lyase subunit beta/citryl-CoA lyase
MAMTSTDAPTIRSLLFAPGNHAEVVAKMPRSGPSAAVIDLEDAVPPNRKADARQIASAAIANLVGIVPLFVRINAPDTVHFPEDIRDGLPIGLSGVVVPKLASAADVDTVVAALDAQGHNSLQIIAGLETVDYVVDLGGVRTSSNHEVATARTMVAQAARLGGVQALDMVVTDFGDNGRFLSEATEARALGFSGKLCIHPSQVPLANKAFRPTSAELAWATEVVAAYATALARGDASIAVNGEMVDEPVAHRARALLAEAIAD